MPALGLHLSHRLLDRLARYHGCKQRDISPAVSKQATLTQSSVPGRRSAQGMARGTQACVEQEPGYKWQQ